MEKEPLPTSLPASLIPPSKRKKTGVGLPGAVPVLPALSGLGTGPALLKETLRSTSPLVNTTPLGTAALFGSGAANLSPKQSFKSRSPVCCLTLLVWTVLLVEDAQMPLYGRWVMWLNLIYNINVMDSTVMLLQKVSGFGPPRVGLCGGCMLYLYLHKYLSPPVSSHSPKRNILCQLMILNWICAYNWST